MILTSKNIYPLLKSVLSGSASELEINSLVRIAYDYALVRLRQLMALGRLHLKSFGLTIESIAFDCIAELFQRDSEGRFPEFAEFFSGDRSLLQNDPEQVEQLFRQLLFNKLNDGVFRLFRENDPILARIIRSLKIAIHHDAEITTHVRLGQTYLSRCDVNDQNDHLPEYPLEELERVLPIALRRSGSAKEFLLSFFEVLNNQEQYRRFYSLIQIAVLFKRTMILTRESIEQVLRVDEQMIHSDLTSVLHGSMSGLRQKLHESYVASGKIDEQLFGSYWLALEEMVFDVFARNDGSELSQSDYLARHFPGLTRESYRKTHRTHFEYMARLVRNHIKEKLRELFL